MHWNWVNACLPTFSIVYYYLFPLGLEGDHLLTADTPQVPMGAREAGHGGQGTSDQLNQALKRLGATEIGVPTSAHSLFQVGKPRPTLE